MILLNNTILRLDYDPSTDILAVDDPDLHYFLLTEIKHKIDTLVNTVINYDVKRVLLDSTKTVISVREADSRETALYLAAGLMKSRVRKVARVQSTCAAVETTAQLNFRHVKDTLLLSFQVQSFASRASARQWLVNDK
ncbi:hypothetical protein DXT99_22195 [Pontibacter diazotrophicus]|uniref:STAS/SEC14 domain-containing protein n=1 Tax=Pontibacter diazotrophicus TaxID=1400979 RepID=A0A3D8L6E4_9BACT|nr:hypothetical protein [Pontibacter diazotrophicus]RDV12980.1 hypothetical protein DXT99_22195 [Pontibacter diazotrophicus]